MLGVSSNLLNKSYKARTGVCSLSELDREVATDSTREVLGPRTSLPDISIESLRQSYCIEDGGVQGTHMLQDVT